MFKIQQALESIRRVSPLSTEGCEKDPERMETRSQESGDRMARISHWQMAPHRGDGGCNARPTRR